MSNSLLDRIQERDETLLALPTPAKNLIKNIEDEAHALWRLMSPFVNAAKTPLIDVQEDSDCFYVFCDLPGVPKSSITVSLDDDLLTVSGRRRNLKASPRAKYYSLERQDGAFERSVPIPSAYKTESVKAELDNGVLEITIPKTGDVSSQQITVEEATAPVRAARPRSSSPRKASASTAKRTSSVKRASASTAKRSARASR